MWMRTCVCKHMPTLTWGEGALTLSMLGDGAWLKGHNGKVLESAKDY